MDAKTLVDNFNKNQSFSSDEILHICSSKTLRQELVDYFRNYHNRPFALGLLSKLTELRGDPTNEVSADDLMLACFLLGRHGQVEDSLKIWKAKRVDFDTYCGLDIQLIAFAGVNETIAYLQTQTSDDANEALQYMTECVKSGDFDNLKEYFNESPWWI